MKKNIEGKEKISIAGRIRASFAGRKFRSGAYVTLVSAIVIVIVFVVNMLISSLNIEFDISSKKMYTITQDTKDLVAGINDDITIYYIAQTGNELETFKKIIEKYDNLSKNINVVYKDPVLYPTFTSQYTDEDVTKNSIIVVNNANGKSKYIPYSDMIVQDFDYNTYKSNTTGIDVEGEVTSALQFVTSESAGKIYAVEGHGESEAGSVFKENINKMNLTIDTLKTITAEVIPDDCDILYINCPTSDFTDEEVQTIKDYLEAGGNVIATVDYMTNGLKNYCSILDYYGIEVVDGMVLEGDRNQYTSNNPTYILPKVKSHDITTKVQSSDVSVFLPQCSGLVNSDTIRSSLSFEPLLTSSDAAYSKVDLETNTIEKEAGDIDGPFNLGLLATDSYNNVESHMVVFASAYTFEDNLLGYGNGKLLNGVVGYFVGDTNTLSIPTKSLEADQIYTTSQQVALWVALIVIILPLALLGTGLFISLRRRKK